MGAAGKGWELWELELPGSGEWDAACEWGRRCCLGLSQHHAGHRPVVRGVRGALVAVCCCRGTTITEILSSGH